MNPDPPLNAEDVNVEMVEAILDVNRKRIGYLEDRERSLLAALVVRDRQLEEARELLRVTASTVTLDVQAAMRARAWLARLDEQALHCPPDSGASEVVGLDEQEKPA